MGFGAVEQLACVKWDLDSGTWAVKPTHLPATPDAPQGTGIPP